MNIPNFIFESLASVFWVKDTVLKFFDAVPDPGSEIQDPVNPGSGMEKFRTGTRDVYLMFNSEFVYPGSAT